MATQSCPNHASLILLTCISGYKFPYCCSDPEFLHLGTTFEPDYSSLGVRETVLHIIGYLVASGASIGCELPSSPNLWPVVRNLNVSRNYQISPREHNFPHPHTWPFRSTALSSQSRCRCLRPNGKPKMML